MTRWDDWRQHERTRWDDFEQREKNRWETTEESIALCYLRWGGIDKTQQQMSNQMDIGALRLWREC
jgi:hypothetical protein